MVYRPIQNGMNNLRALQLYFICEEVTFQVSVLEKRIKVCSFPG